jgi:hypothetical protein
MDSSKADSSSNVTTSIQYLAMTLHELLLLQQCRAPTHMQLDMHFQFPNFLGQMKGDTVESWFYSISTYFMTCLEMNEDMKL